MKIALIIIVVLILTILLFYSYYGGFYKIQITTEKQGGETVVYQEITGDYRQSGQVMDKIYYSLLNDYKITTYKGIGIYYDNPQKVEKDKLRSEAGCIIEENDYTKLSDLPENFKIKRIDTKEYITTSFPYKGKMSVMFSIMKVYPALQKYTADNGFNEEGAVIEIYDIPNKKIFYRKEIIK